MKFYEKAMAALLAANIEYHWSHILHCRRRANRLLEGGAAINSGRLLRLNRRTTRHAVATMRKEADFESRFVPAARGRR